MFQWVPEVTTIHVHCTCRQVSLYTKAFYSELSVSRKVTLKPDFTVRQMRREVLFTCAL